MNHDSGTKLLLVQLVGFLVDIGSEVNEEKLF